jgi:hypothetical protein
MAITKMIEDLMDRIHSFVTRVMNDPSLLQKNRQEFTATVEAWRKVQSSMPGVVKMTAQQFEAMLTEQAKADRQTRMKFAADLAGPTSPGPNATEAQLARYQRDLGKYNRMFEMYSKIMANSHEMKKSIIGNFPR